MKAAHNHIIIIMEYIEANLHESLSIERIAEQFNLSPSTLQRRFKKQYKVPMHKFILQQRMDKAMEMLKEGSHSIADVRLNVGYHDPANFTTAFIKYFHVSPSHVSKSPNDTE
ncbi:MAG: AraC family transcriptional regulator [Candidatus Pedobacter colombiensis]|uniref:AraC family transcriptional regulator n=1 Tax=Candidatus Pedobacter colombiensis TaxID=3121371 RepID=A0AAJ6B7Q5_9SPHI|nr:AraC family transcriptional regulator [Pedobacter sp.]WEK21347.1 MAG: AraC family transcriptional regulator [Pedobacter sp.]